MSDDREVADMAERRCHAGPESAAGT